MSHDLEFYVCRGCSRWDFGDLVELTRHQLDCPGISEEFKEGAREWLTAPRQQAATGAEEGE